MARNHMLGVDVKQLGFLFPSDRLGLCASWMEAATAWKIDRAGNLHKQFDTAGSGLCVRSSFETKIMVNVTLTCKISVTF